MTLHRGQDSNSHVVDRGRLGDEYSRGNLESIRRSLPVLKWRRWHVAQGHSNSAPVGDVDEGMAGERLSENIFDVIL